MKWIKAYLAWEAFWCAHALYERRKLYQDARRATDSVGKPLLVVGAPYGMYGCGDVTLDLKDTGECPNHVTGSVEDIPFPDKHFGAAFCSHVIEHTGHPYQALAELSRVADHVFIAWPRPWRTIAWANKGHTWLMVKQGEGFEFKRLRDGGNAPRFFGVL